MRMVLAVIGAGFILTLLALVVGRQLARRRQRLEQADVSPRWLNENTYGQDGDEPWK